MAKQKFVVRKKWTNGTPFFYLYEVREDGSELFYYCEQSKEKLYEHFTSDQLNKEIVVSRFTWNGINIVEHSAENGPLS